MVFECVFGTPVITDEGQKYSLSISRPGLFSHDAHVHVHAYKSSYHNIHVHVHVCNVCMYTV